MNRVLASLRLNWLAYAFIVLLGLAAWGWIKPWIEGPDLRFSTITRTRPVPVKVETVRWMTKVATKIKRERVEVPVEVIREVPVKVAERLKEGFKVSLPDLRAEGRELVDVLEVPKAPHGGEMALTVQTATGKIDGIFRAKPAPFFEAGGLRELGGGYNPFSGTAILSYRQDLVRIGPVVVVGRGYLAAPLKPGQAVDVGGDINAVIRF